MSREPNKNKFLWISNFQWNSAWTPLESTTSLNVRHFYEKKYWTADTKNKNLKARYFKKINRGDISTPFFCLRALVALWGVGSKEVEFLSWQPGNWDKRRLLREPRKPLALASPVRRVLVLTWSRIVERKAWVSGACWLTSTPDKSDSWMETPLWFQPLSRFSSFTEGRGRGTRPWPPQPLNEMH